MVSCKGAKLLRSVFTMAETQDQSHEVIAKEITIALIQKSSYGSDKLLEYACESFDKVYKQIVETYNTPRK